MALRTPEWIINCRGPLDPYDAVEASSQSGVTSSNPGPGVPHAAELSPLAKRLISSWPEMPIRHSQWRTASMADEKPAPASAGLTDQVASSLPSQPSSLGEVAERPG